MTDSPINRESEMQQSDSDSEDQLKTLMNLAGPRAEISDDIEQRVYGAVRGEWQRASAPTVRKLRFATWAVPMALAASLVIAVFVGNSEQTSGGLSVGTVVRMAGVTADSGISVGDVVKTGDILETVDGQGLSIALRDAVSLRVAGNSVVRIDAADEITLIAGQTYVDSGASIYPQNAITVHTLGGSATDIGTQFSVGYDLETMGVAVREGRVDISNQKSKFSVLAGEQVTVMQNGLVETGEIGVTDSAWDWAISLAPPFDTDRRSLLDFLKWASRETGKSLEFKSDEVRMSAMASRLNAPIDGLSVEAAISDVFRTVPRYSYVIGENSITISK